MVPIPPVGERTRLYLNGVSKVNRFNIRNSGYYTGPSSHIS